MIRACAWCDAARTPEQVAADAAARAGHDVTHGICDAHEAQVRADLAARAARE